MPFPTHSFFYIRKHIPKHSSVQKNYNKRKRSKLIVFGQNSFEKYKTNQYINQSTSSDMKRRTSDKPSNKTRKKNSDNYHKIGLFFVEILHHKEQYEQRNGVVV